MSTRQQPAEIQFGAWNMAEGPRRERPDDGDPSGGSREVRGALVTAFHKTSRLPPEGWVERVVPTSWVGQAASF